MTVDLCFHETHTSHMSAEAHECPKCKTMRYFWISRDGRTLCLYCDDQRGRDEN